MEQTARKFGVDQTHLGILGDGFTSGKGLTYKRALNRVKRSLDFGKSISTVEGYAMPPDYGTLAFDYELYQARDAIAGYVLLSVTGPAGELVISDSSNWRNLISEHISVKRCEIFTMSQDESPAFYVAGMTSGQHCRSLEILRKF